MDNISKISPTMDEVLTTLIKEGADINGYKYDCLTVNKAIVLWNELCPDCKAMLRALIAEHMQNDVEWQTVYDNYPNIVGRLPQECGCKHCIGITKQTSACVAFNRAMNDKIVLTGEVIGTFDVQVGQNPIEAGEEDTGGYRGDPGNDLEGNEPGNRL